MQKGIVKVSLIHPNAQLPHRQHTTDIGLDLFVASVTKDHDNIYKVDFGIAVEPPQGFYMELFAGPLIHKSNTFMVNGVGVINPDDRESISMMIWCDEATVLPKVGDRFGQLVLKKGWYAEVRSSHELSFTKRNGSSSGGAVKVKAPRSTKTRYSVRDPETGVSRPLFDDDDDSEMLS